MAQEYSQNNDFKENQEKTENPEIYSPISGFWKTNNLISDSDKPKKKFTLRHLTSFEENGMEDHGKKLKNTFIEFLKKTKAQNNFFDLFE